MTTDHENKLIDLSARIMSEPPEEIAYQHVVLCHLGFPRSKTAERVFERKSGNASVRLEAGALWDGNGWIPQPLPYGSIPRLVFIAAITRAIQQKSPLVELGNSMRASLRTLGLADTGAQNWRNVARQSSALAALNLRLGFLRDGKPTSVQGAPIREFTAWAHRDPDQLALLPSTLEFSLDFFRALENHCVPLDQRAIAMLSRYPMALDVYCWLAHRLYRVKKHGGDRVPWLSLREQFGQEFGDQKDFKRKMKQALHRAKAAYPAARLDTFGSGIVLLPSPPPVARAQVVVSFPRTTNKAIKSS